MTFRFTLLVPALALCSLCAQGQVQKINTFAGNGIAGYTGDGGNPVSATLWDPEDVVLDSNLNVYIVDFSNYRIRKVSSTTGLITTIAGTGAAGNSGNGSIGSSADIYAKGIAADRRGNIYFSDPSDNVIRKINSFGFISQYAGGGPSGTSIHYGYTGDGGKADTARFSIPLGLAVDDTGNLFIADAGNNVIRRIDTFGNITTFAGSGVQGFAGDGSAATAASLDSPYAVAVDRYENVYINDYKNGVIREVDSTTGIINTVAGYYGMTPGYSGDNIPAITATLYDPRGLAVDTFGNFYIADAANNRIRKVTIATGIITTAAGNGTQGFGGDLSYVDGCNLFNPLGMAVDKYGDIFIADAANERIRKTYYTTGVPNITAAVVLSAYPNPCNNEVTLSGLENRDVVNVFDITGRQVSVWQAAAAGVQSFDVNQLSPGVYMLQVSASDGTRKAIVKMVKE